MPELVAARDSVEVKRKLDVYGYVKNLESLSFDEKFTNNLSGNLVHNRLNARWKPSGNITITAECRNRLFWGEVIKSTPGFATQLRNEHEWINLQKAWINTTSLLLHTNVERLNIEYIHGHWKFKLGRQRINWGVSTTWNPNDLFNTYNFLDFDYEERPGVDGGRIQYLVGQTASAELAYAPLGNNMGHVAALKYNANKWGYDLQLNAGWYKEHITIGAGWAGHVSDAGFKGEAQYFFPNNEQPGRINLTIEGDYLFKKGWYLRSGLLFTNRGLSGTISSWNAINLKLSPENLMPTRWNILAGTSKQLTPLFTVNANVVYAPGTQLCILLPSLSYNLATNLDIDLVWQSFFARLQGEFQAVNHTGYLRMKWSF